VDCGKYLKSHCQTCARNTASVSTSAVLVSATTTYFTWFLLRDSETRRRLVSEVAATVSLLPRTSACRRGLPQRPSSSIHFGASTRKPSVRTFCDLTSSAHLSLILVGYFHLSNSKAHGKLTVKRAVHENTGITGIT